MLSRRAFRVLSHARRLSHPRRLGQVAASSAGPAASLAGPAAPVDPELQRLSYGVIDVRYRYDGKRERMRLKKKPDEQRIPGILHARGEFDNILLDVPVEPLRRAQLDGLLVLQKRGKVKFTGPPFVLRLQGPDPDALVPGGAREPHLPVSVVRARPVNIIVHPLTDLPLGVTFVLSPPDRPMRIRIPVRAVNTEKCVGLKAGGWVNITHRYVDVAVAPGVVPPQYATIDVGGLGLKDRLPLSALEFPTKGEGSRVVLPGDTVACVISSV